MTAISLLIRWCDAMSQEWWLHKYQRSFPLAVGAMGSSQ